MSVPEFVYDAKTHEEFDRRHFCMDNPEYLEENEKYLHPQIYTFIKKKKEEAIAEMKNNKLETIPEVQSEMEYSIKRT